MGQCLDPLQVLMGTGTLHLGGGGVGRLGAAGGREPVAGFQEGGAAEAGRGPPPGCRALLEGACSD